MSTVPALSHSPHGLADPTDQAAPPAHPWIIPLPQRARAGEKTAYTTARIDLDRAVALLTRGRPRAGDLVLAQVEEIGQHTRLESPHGRRAPLHPGDRIVLAYGSRYAPDQFEALVPEDLGPCELVAAGGIAGRVINAHASMKPATRLRPLGILLDGSGRRLNMADGALPPVPRTPGPGPLVVAVVGSSMNCGKTTTGATLCQGLTRAGVRVGAAKVTGTGAGGDVWAFGDHGAHPVLDFTAAGLASTCGLTPDVLVEVFTRSIDRLAAEACEVVVIEVADGLYQQETAALVQEPEFSARVDAVLFAASDSLCGAAGLAWLRARCLDPLAVTGVVSASPLATRELVEQTGAQVWSSAVLSDPAHAALVLEGLRTQRERARSERDPG